MRDCFIDVDNDFFRDILSCNNIKFKCGEAGILIGYTDADRLKYELSQDLKTLLLQPKINVIQKKEEVYFETQSVILRKKSLFRKALWGTKKVEKTRSKDVSIVEVHSLTQALIRRLDQMAKEDGIQVKSVIWGGPLYGEVAVFGKPDQKITKEGILHSSGQLVLIEYRVEY